MHNLNPLSTVCGLIRIIRLKLSDHHSRRVVHSCCSAFLKTTRGRDRKRLILHILWGQIRPSYRKWKVESESVARLEKEKPPSESRHRRLGRKVGVDLLDGML